MGVSADEQFLHDWVIRQAREKFSKLYNEININPGEEQNSEFKGHYPDILLGSYGQVVQIIEVETKSTVKEEKVQYWKSVSELGVQLIILVPKELQNTLRDICWKNGLAAKVKIGSFDVDIKI